jgi:hypothetical protein
VPAGAQRGESHVHTTTYYTDIIAQQRNSEQVTYGTYMQQSETEMVAAEGHFAVFCVKAPAAHVRAVCAYVLTHAVLLPVRE